MNAQEQLRALIRRHHVNLIDQVHGIGELLAQSAATPSDAAALITKAQAISHQIKGSAGSIGFAEVARAAAVLDGNLKEMRTRPDPIAAEQLQPALQLLDQLRTAAETTSPEESTLYNADISRLLG
jgi:HPt (histidine-containing phosphotransfer) domain-containing protein